MIQVRHRSRRKRTKEREHQVQGLLLATLFTEVVTDEECATIWSHGDPNVSRMAKKLPDVKPLPYRQVLATWPDHWRERWGRLTNEIEDHGLSWRDAESRAFVEVWSQFRASTDVLRN